MNNNFFVDFSVFFVLGLLAGVEWMLAFSIATFLAMMTRLFQMRFEERRMVMRAQRVRANRDALPAFRRNRDGARGRR